MSKEIFGQEALQKIREFVKDIDIGMLTTKGNGICFHSRPMSSNRDVDGEGNLTFFTRKDSRLVEELMDDTSVCVTFVNPKSNIYVSISGDAELRTDRATIEQHWKPELKAWFPIGQEDPTLIVVRVAMNEAEYWESQGGFVSHTLRFARSLVTGKSANGLEHGQVKA